MNQILTNIQNKIATDLPQIMYVDENWGQLDLYGPEIPVKWPCILIDFNSGQFSNIGRDLKASPENRQQGTTVIELTVANLKLTNSSFKAPASQKSKAFDIWQHVKDLHIIIHGWSPEENAGGLMRTGFSKVRRDDGVQEIRILYSTGLNDC